MNSTTIVEKARQMAMEGDYISAKVYYEECKAKLEKGGGYLRIPSQKKLYDEIRMEMEMIDSILRELEALSDSCNYSKESMEIPAGALDSQSKRVQPSQLPASNVSQQTSTMMRTTKSRVPRMSVPVCVKKESEVRAKIGTNAMVHPRKTAPAASIPEVEKMETKEPVSLSIASSDDRYQFSSGYKGPMDPELVRMIEAEVVERSPQITWNSIAGLHDVKKLLEEVFILPQWVPEFFTGIRRPWSGILLYGPPGTGKTMLAKAIATECKTTFFNISTSSIASKWRGESEKLVKLLFEMARFYAPSTVFLDEVDAIGGQRTSSQENDASLRVKSELLTQMDGMAAATSESTGVVTVVAATNLPWNLDEALRRRFEKRLYIPLPGEEEREAMFRINLKEVLVDSDVDFVSLAKRTEGYSGADIANLCRDASMMCLRRMMDQLRKEGLEGELLQHRAKEMAQNVQSYPVSNNDLSLAIEKISSSIGKADIKRLEEWTAKFSAS